MTHAVETTDRWAPYRPKPHTLMVMLRASAVSDGQGGPWLTLHRAYDNPKIFTHHIAMSAPTAYSNNRVVMCSGVELLGQYCAITRRVPADIAHPDTEELRRLGDWCVQRTNVELWEFDLPAWVRKHEGPAARDRREQEAADAASRVRSLRWLLAEEWLR